MDEHLAGQALYLQGVREQANRLRPGVRTARLQVADRARADRRQVGEGTLGEPGADAVGAEQLGKRALCVAFGHHGCTSIPLRRTRHTPTRLHDRRP